MRSRFSSCGGAITLAVSLTTACATRTEGERVLVGSSAERADAANQVALYEVDGQFELCDAMGACARGFDPAAFASFRDPVVALEGVFEIGLGLVGEGERDDGPNCSGAGSILRGTLAATLIGVAGYIFVAKRRGRVPRETDAALRRLADAALERARHAARRELAERYLRAGMSEAEAARVLADRSIGAYYEELLRAPWYELPRPEQRRFRVGPQGAGWDDGTAVIPPSFDAAAGLHVLVGKLTGDLAARTGELERLLTAAAGALAILGGAVAAIEVTSCE